MITDYTTEEKVCSEKELKVIEKIRDRYLAWKEKWISLEESYSNFLKYYSNLNSEKL